MTSIASVLKAEITRLSRKEVRQHLGPLRKTVAKQRGEIADLKRKVAVLQKSGGKAARAVAPIAPADADQSGSSVRFQARGLVSLRKRLGLSQKALGDLIGVGGQTILNWEQKKATPRRQYVLALAKIRTMGKRELKKHVGS